MTSVARLRARGGPKRVRVGLWSLLSTRVLGFSTRPLRPAPSLGTAAATAARARCEKKTRGRDLYNVHRCTLGRFSAGDGTPKRLRGREQVTRHLAAIAQAEGFPLHVPVPVPFPALPQLENTGKRGKGRNGERVREIVITACLVLLRPSASASRDGRGCRTGRSDPAPERGLADMPDEPRQHLRRDLVCVRQRRGDGTPVLASVRCYLR